jgi:hypothetical protein
MDYGIQGLYDSITERHSLSTIIMDPITNNYCQLILNVDENNSVHVIKRKKEGNKKGNTSCLHENTRLFSVDSKTPLCLVSVEKPSLGHIVKTNIEFDGTMG